MASVVCLREPSKRLPKAPPSLHQAVRWIGQLRGFLGRKGDGEPGVKVLGRGWTRLQDIVETWKLFNSSPQKMWVMYSREEKGLGECA